MTAVQSIGYHTPSALPHLVAENILPPDPSSASYTWKTFCTADNEEELLYTSTCVAWSQGKVLRKLFTFDVEQETVQHALLTNFPSPTLTGLSRALVVLLQNQAHIFFLDGASHLVKLNFEVESAFAAPRGIILQRKLPNTLPVTDSQSQSIGKAPAPPQNSFAPHFPLLSKLNQPNRDYNSLLNFNILGGALSLEDDSMPRHFSLTSPLSEFSLVVRTPSNHHGLWNSRATKSLEALETAEDMIYVSAQDELPNHQSADAAQLLLFVTVDAAKGVFSIWNASYLEAKSASKALTGGSTPTTTVKNRRRSSFVNTGATTPVARPRDKPRESLDAKAKSNTSNTQRRKSKRKEEKSLKEVEDNLASQVDPGYEPRRTARESRRVSSMISRADLNPSFDRSAFQELATQHAPSFNQSARRGQSLGNTDRLSFGASSNRKLRAPTPGAFSRLSIEDLSELSGINPAPNASQASTTMDEYEPLADLSTIDEDVGGYDFQAPVDGLNKEVFARKFAEIPVYVGNSRSKLPQAPTTAPIYKVFTLLSPVSFDEREPFGRRFFIYIFNPISRECVQVEFSVRAKHSTTTNEIQENSKKPQVLPSFRNVSRFSDIVDILKVSDSHHSRVLLLRSGRNGVTYTSVFAPWSPEALYKVPIKRLRLFNLWDISSYLGHDPKAVGVSRSMVVPKLLHQLLHPGPNGSFDIAHTEKNFHRLFMKLWPKNKLVSLFMDAIFFILPLSISEKLLTIWWSSYNTLENILQQEWYALAISISCLFLSCEDDKRKRRPRKSSVFHPPETSSKLMEHLEASWTGTNIDSLSAWSWTSKITTHTTEDRPRSRSSAPVTPSKLRKLYQQREPTAMARELLKSGDVKDVVEALKNHRGILLPLLPKLMAILHILREEMKLASTSKDLKDAQVDILAPLMAQLGRWLDWSEWDWNSPKYYHYELTTHHDFEDMSLFTDTPLPIQGFQHPPSILEWIQRTISRKETSTFPLIEDIVSSQVPDGLELSIKQFTPRIKALIRYLPQIQNSKKPPNELVESMVSAGIDLSMVGTLPESILAIVKGPVVQCQSNPPTTWNPTLLSYVSREDLNLRTSGVSSVAKFLPKHIGPESVRDVHYITQSTENIEMAASTPNSDRMAVSRLIFSQDRRFTEAVHMIEPYRTAVAECIPSPDWTDVQTLEAQKEVHNWVMTRTFSLAPGLAFTHYDSRVPLLSEKFAIHGYNTLCVMKPLNNTLSLDRANFTEEKYAWSWFHAGVAGGLSISKTAPGIDSSWIVFNRPHELNNRHAGLLLALGLNGHLKSMAKWLSFKYLTPKHTMTSIGILLGLSASHIGSMDALVTRLLSVHVTRMLPQGAAELNISSLTQTAGLMGIGLLYYNTQHRRMSEVMLSEIENMESEDVSGTGEAVRDEGYRLAAAYALGLINLGQGSDLKGLHDMRLVERLLSIAVGPRQVNLVHLVDQATAGAAVAIALIFMKTGNKSIARKIDVPDTVAQFDFVRPDILLLRTLAKHLILWDDIQATYSWVVANLPKEYTRLANLENISFLSSDHMPFYNILAGLLWSVSLRYAGSGNIGVRNFLINFLDQFLRICRLPALRYDSRLTRNTVRNCQDLIALAVATVMAGTGDLEVFRRIRSLHGRVNPDTPYGSHMAAHMALGALFFGAGCYTFGTNNFAIASLVIAFYPVFPMDVTDNQAHLQAFRHFWALAAEARCIIPRDIDTNRAISMDLEVHMKNGSVQRLSAPKILPELDSISRISTVSSDYWPVTLDFAGNPAHLSSFRQTQTIHVHRRAPHEAHSTALTATLLTVNDARRAAPSQAARESLFRLPAFANFEITDFGSLLDADDRTSESLELSGGAIDDWLLLGNTARKGVVRDRLWHLRILLAWSELQGESDGSGQARWIRREVLERWKAIVGGRAQSRAQIRG